VSRLRTRRGIGLLAFATVMAIGCVLLGLWQLDRYEQRGERNDAVRSALAEDPVPLETLVSAEGSASAVDGSSVDDGVEWRSVSVRGTYDDTGTVTLRLRPVEGQSGVHVLTPLVTTDGATVLVDRGFLPTATRGTEAVDVPPAASGTVEVIGRVRLSEDVAAAGVDPDSSPPSIRFVNLEDLQQVGVLAAAGDGSVSPDAAGDVAPVWLERVEQSPAEDSALTAIPVPTLSAGTSLIYAVQWFIFGVIAVVGYVLLVRRDRRNAPADGPVAGASATGGSPAASSETAPSR
jgi:cytochrome oxidase assembly protein ShyY1